MMPQGQDGGKARILVIQGIGDPMAVPENGRILKKDNQKRVKLINLEKAGHLMIYEQPERIVTEIISFLSNLK